MTRINTKLSLTRALGIWLLRDPLTRNDRFDLTMFQQGDDPVSPVPDTIFGSPNLVGLDLSTAGQHY
jgi:hypothetical protein